MDSYTTWSPMVASFTEPDVFGAHHVVVCVSTDSFVWQDNPTDGQNLCESRSHK
jgi:hypothetical protein